MGTVLADNPQLDVRHVPTQRQPTLVLIDSRLEVPLDASIFIANRAILIYTLATNFEKNSALAARGATVITLPGSDAAPAGKLDLKAVMRDLAAREINEVHVEAGQKLNASLVRAGLVDEFLLYLAPKWAGQGEGIAEIGPLTALSETLPFKYQSIAQIGPDLRILARGIGRDVF
jgi:diaminohydroxyphosphoribosylaminopyrimidine deaminase/5-amino-6-(5-phosphoribosylamino)uracil reductase